MKKLLTTCVTTAACLAATVAPASATAVHSLSSSVSAKLSHLRAGHKLTASQLRKDKATASKLLTSLRSHKAHSASFFYAGSAYSDPMEATSLVDTNVGNNGTDPSKYVGAGASRCYLTTAFTFTTQPGGLACIAVRNDLYEDSNTGNVFGFQLLCPDYGAGQAKDNVVYGPQTAGQLGCDYADTYWFAISRSSLTTGLYGLFQYEN